MSHNALNVGTLVTINPVPWGLSTIYLWRKNGQCVCEHKHNTVFEIIGKTKPGDRLNFSRSLAIARIRYTLIFSL